MSSNFGANISIKYRRNKTIFSETIIRKCYEFRRNSSKNFNEKSRHISSRFKTYLRSKSCRRPFKSKSMRKYFKYRKGGRNVLFVTIYNSRPECEYEPKNSSTLPV